MLSWQLKKIGRLKLENTMNIYSTAYNLEFNLASELDKHRIRKRFTAFYCEGCSIAPLIDHANNPIYQELINCKGCRAGEN